MSKTSDRLQYVTSQIEATKGTLERLEKEAKKLVKEAEAESQRFLKWKPADEEAAYRIFQLADGTLDYELLHHDARETELKGPLFKSTSQAIKFADAFQVLLEMRMQDGVFAPEPDERSYCIVPQRDGSLKVINGQCVDAIPSTLFCRFQTEHQARAAIAKVGRERIIKSVQ